MSGTRRLLFFLRYVLPAAVCLTGLVILVAGDFDDDALDGAAVFLGAGGSIWLMNVLFRVGVSNESDRVREEDARAFFDAHGRWPDDPR